MIRLRWRGQATLQACRTRFFSSRQTPSDAQPRHEWPQLQRRKPFPSTITPNDPTPVDVLERRPETPKGLAGEFIPNKDSAWDSEGTVSSGARVKKTGDRPPPHNLRQRKPQHSNGRVFLDWEEQTADVEPVVPKSPDRNKNMLLISGVSTNLSTSDFFRLAPSCLSDWESSIKKVEQRRDPKTFEPQGIYQVSFTSSTSAKAYQANLERLMGLSQHKLRSTTGLWQLSVPHRLLPPDDTHVNKDVARLTVTSPGQKQISITRVRTSTKAWAKDLSSILRPLGYGDKPPAVLISVHPGDIQASKLQHFIAQDGWQQDLAWKISKPLVLEQALQKKEEPKTPRHMRKGSRFVVACETEWEARRFHRNWNERIMSREEDGESVYRHSIKTSIVTW